ncbi:MAG: class III signal peptide-containing protein [Methanobrevibacter sp.]|nr:class III signal peptide-containing protein [Candidatus Methanovirga basalitermitum]
MENLNFSIQKLEKDEKGQGAAEYILLFGGVIIIAIVALIIYKSYFGNGTTDLNASKDVNEVRNMIKS